MPVLYDVCLSLLFDFTPRNLWKMAVLSILSQGTALVLPWLPSFFISSNEFLTLYISEVLSVSVVELYQSWRSDCSVVGRIC